MIEYIPDRTKRTAEEVKYDLAKALLKKGIPSTGAGTDNNSYTSPNNEVWLKKNSSRLRISRGPRPR